jgi:hypothetical protein
VIPAALVIAVVIFKFVLGNSSNFQDNNPELNPLPGNFLGIVYKGGFIVPILMSLLLIVITFVIERFVTIGTSKGKGRVDAFIGTVRMSLSKGDIDTATKACDTQQGSIAAVVKAGLKAYKNMEGDKNLDKEHKVATIQKEIEEANKRASEKESLEIDLAKSNIEANELNKKNAEANKKFKKYSIRLIVLQAILTGISILVSGISILVSVLYK